MKDAIVGLFITTLFATCCGMLFVGMDLAMHVSGKFAKGLIVSGTIERIRLPCPLGTLCLNILA